MVEISESSKILNPSRVIAFICLGFSDSSDGTVDQSDFRYPALWLCTCVMIIVGCRDSVMTKTLPAPVRNEVEYQVEGRAYRVWAGDSFEFGDVRGLHFIVLRGVIAPSEKHPLFFKARSRLYGLVHQKRIRIEVVDRDEQMREAADVYTIDPYSVSNPEENVGLRMIELGFGRYDGSEFTGADSLRQAEQVAKEKKIGIWAHESTHPLGSSDQLE